MACPTYNVYLGPTGNELLPAVKYVGSVPGFPTTIEPQTEEAKMIDGSRRWNFLDSCLEFGIGWGYLTKAQLDILTALVALKQILRYQDNFVNAFWHEVVITAFSYDPVFAGMRDYQYYKADMTLRQA